MWNIDELLNKLDIDFTRLHDLLVYDPHAPMIFSSGIFLWLFAAFIVFYLLLQHSLLVSSVVITVANLSIDSLRLMLTQYLIRLRLLMHSVLRSMQRTTLWVSITYLMPMEETQWPSILIWPIKLTVFTI